MAMPFFCRVGMLVLVAVPRAIGMNVFMAVPVPGVAATGGADRR